MMQEVAQHAQNAQKLNGLNVLIMKSLTPLYLRRAGPKVLHPDNSERQPTLRYTPCQFCPQREAPGYGVFSHRFRSLGVHFLGISYVEPVGTFDFYLVKGIGK